MIKMYVMHTCPDCEYVEKQVEGNPNFEVIDIGKHVRNLKQFIKLRDTNPAFDEAKAVDDLGPMLCAGGWNRNTLLEGCRTGTTTTGGRSSLQYRRQRVLKNK